jgi:hypothetical protein
LGVVVCEPLPRDPLFGTLSMHHLCHYRHIPMITSATTSLHVLDTEI